MKKQKKQKKRLAYRYAGIYIIMLIPYVIVSIYSYRQMNHLIDTVILKEQQEKYAIVETVLRDQFDTIEETVLSMVYKNGVSQNYKLSPQNIDTVSGRMNIISSIHSIIYPKYIIDDIGILYERNKDVVFTKKGTMSIETAIRSDSINGLLFTDFDESFHTSSGFVVTEANQLYYKYNINASLKMSRQIVAKVSMQHIQQLLKDYTDDLEGTITIKCAGETVLQSGEMKKNQNRRNYSFSSKLNDDIELTSDIYIYRYDTKFLKDIRIMVSISTLVFVAALIIVWGVNKINVKPLKQMESMINKQQEENAILNDRIRRANPFVEKQLMSDLLKGKILARGIMEYGNDLRSDKLRELLDMDEWRVLLLGLGAYDWSYGKLSQFQETMNVQMDHLNLAFFWVERLNGDVILVLGGNEGDLDVEKIQFLVKGIEESLALFGVLDCSVGYGATVYNMNEIQDSYRDSIKALSNTSTKEESAELRTTEDEPEENLLMKKDQIISYVHANIGAPMFCRASTADYFMMTENQLTRFFKQVIGMSFRDYVFKYRMQRACELLRDTNESIAIIMQEIGYNDLPNFTRTFRRATGMTPGKYREEYKARIMEPSR